MTRSSTSSSPGSAPPSAAPGQSRASVAAFVDGHPQRAMQCADAAWRHVDRGDAAHGGDVRPPRSTTSRAATALGHERLYSALQAGERTVLRAPRLGRLDLRHGGRRAGPVHRRRPARPPPTRRPWPPRRAKRPLRHRRSGLRRLDQPPLPVLTLHPVAGDVDHEVGLRRRDATAEHLHRAVGGDLRRQPVGDVLVRAGPVDRRAAERGGVAGHDRQEPADAPSVSVIVRLATTAVAPTGTTSAVVTDAGHLVARVLDADHAVLPDGDLAARRRHRQAGVVDAHRGDDVERAGAGAAGPRRASPTRLPPAMYHRRAVGGRGRTCRRRWSPAACVGKLGLVEQDSLPLPSASGRPSCRQPTTPAPLLDAPITPTPASVPVCSPQTP